MSKVMSIILSIIAMVLNLFQFQKNETFIVDFINYDSTIISSCEVILGESATPPTSPKKSGATFLGWQGNYINVQKNEAVKAIFDDEKNVFMISSANGKIGDTVTVLVSLNGEVETCGFDIAINYDDSLEFVSSDCDLDLDIVVNTKAGTNKIVLNYSSAKNKNKKADVMEITFKIKETNKNALGVKIDMNSNIKIAGNTVADAQYSIIDGVIWIK